MSASYLVGAAKVDITPPLSVPFLGFAPRRHDFFTGVHDRLTARVVYVGAGADEALVVSAESIGFADDLLGPGRDFVAEVRERLSQASGVPAGQTMLAAAHVHSAPETLNLRPLIDHPGVAQWLGRLADDLAAAAHRARAAAFPAALRIGRGRLPGVSHNRRGDPCLDDEVAVLHFAGEDGRSVLLTGFACHPVIVQAQELVSADFVGVFQASVEGLLQGTEACVFLQGACGDINPVAYSVTRLADRFAGVRWTGLALAGEVLRTVALLGVEDAPPEPAIVRTASRVVELPSRPLPGGEELAGIEARAAAGGTMEAEIVVRVAEGDQPFRGEVQLIRLGNAVLVGIPGEPFCQLGTEIKDRAKPLTAVPVGYANGYLGYLAPPEAWEKGGYEVSCGPWSKVGPEAFGVILETVEGLLGEVGDSQR